jgi:hypothetical protein
LLLFIFGGFEKEITKIAKKLNFQKYDTFIDFRAYFGVHSLQFAQHFNNSNIFSFDPPHYAFAPSLTNLKLNPPFSQKIFPYQIFLASPGIKHPPSLYSPFKRNSGGVSPYTAPPSRKSADKSTSSTLDEFII